MLVLLLGLIEMGIRVHDFIRGTSANGRGSWFWAFQQDRYLSYRPRENVNLTIPGGNKMDTNSAGFRDVEIPISPAGPRRLIICQGESSTWGTGTSDRYHTWPCFLGRELRQACSEPFVTFNAGVPGYTLLENVQQLQMRLLKYKPEAIVYMGFRNDLVYYASSLDDDWDVNQYPRVLASVADTWVNRSLMESSLFTLLTSKWRARHPLDFHGVGPKLGAPHPTARGEALFRDQIALLSMICRRHSVQLLWVDQPISPIVGTNYDEMRAILHDELKRQDIPLIAAHDRYDHKAVPMLDDVHFSDAGNEQLAKILAPQVLELLRKPYPSGSETGIPGEEPQRR